ncbi:nicotinamide riboside transporter PnuC [Aureivirga sp. CE67]|uniref:nicotinamide riboside transporter PnuC n=1 Tax=Aureivirga sp. CE67 TaxID=1788983 RepID=UPI0018CA3AA2|nr:nicotinamide riboside transporter PnuC [Aureivirga sp. CE67]
MEEFVALLTKPYQHTDISAIVLEILAVIFGITNVFLTKKENIKSFFFGIGSTLIFIYLCFQNHLYGDIIINVYFTLMSLYGFYQWSRKDENNTQISVSRTTWKDWQKAFYIFVASFLFVLTIYKFNDRISDITGWMDTFTTSIFFAAMWLSAHKKLECWFLWMTGNLISIPLYFSKGLLFASFLFCVYFTLAVVVYFDWKKKSTKLSDKLVLQEGL